jgi:hypothetical protein
MGLSSEDYGTAENKTLDQLLEVTQAIMPPIRNTSSDQALTQFTRSNFF